MSFFSFPLSLVAFLAFVIKRYISTPVQSIAVRTPYRMHPSVEIARYYSYGRLRKQLKFEIRDLGVDSRYVIALLISIFNFDYC